MERIYVEIMAKEDFKKTELSELCEINKKEKKY